MCVYGNLIEIVRTAPLQRDQLFYGRKVDVQDISIQSHFPHISPGVGNARLGHPFMDGCQLVSTEQNCNMIDGVPNNTPIPPTPPELDAKPLDKVKEPKECRKGRELER